jgi:mono/diheme cytochrome c family protein
LRTVVVSLASVCLAARLANAGTDAGAAFTRKCSSCHTFGKGDLVGPDLKGATDRHSRAWLTAWITSSETVIKSGDPAAFALFTKYKRQRMPDQSFSPSELAAFLDYLAAGGPEADARRKDRRADTATPVEIEMGRSLFVGRRVISAGGAPCSACHRVGSTGGAGGSLGPDLTRAYSKYQDKVLASLLARECFPQVPNTRGQPRLTEQETFAVKAFLRQADMDQRPADRAQSATTAVRTRR